MNNQETDYTYSEIEEFILNNKSGDAIKLLVSLLNNNKNDVEILFEKAMIYFYVDSDLINTLKELDILLQINPSHIEALLLKGEILAGIHNYGKAIKTFNEIHPKILPYGYKKLIEYISEYNRKGTDYYSVYDFHSYFVYFYIEEGVFKRLNGGSLEYLEGDVLEMGLIWQNLDTNLYGSLKENIQIISGMRLSEEEPIEEREIGKKKCIVCGKKLKKNHKNLCKSCMKKQYASRIIKKLVSVVNPEIVFKKQDLKSLNLDDIQIRDYIWTLQEFNLIDVDNNKFKLKDENTLNNFRMDSKMEPIDFDSIKEKNKLEKTCKTCGETLPISQFYKSSDGYEDNCKICKKRMVTARYLEDIIKHVGFDIEFDESDLNEYILNKNQIMGMIWSLQENDLLLDKKNNLYVLADKSKCLTFLDKYSTNFDIKEFNNKSKLNVKSKSKSPVEDNLSKSDVVPESDGKINNEHKSYLKSSKDKKRLMDIILKLSKQGKTRGEAAKIANIPLYKINHWYKEGEQGFGKENVFFYNELKKIEKKFLNSQDSNERKQMEFVLKLLRQGKSREEVVKLTELSESTLLSWYNQGKEKSSENAVYFYNEVKKIKNNKLEKIKAKDLKVQIKEFISKFMDLDEKIINVDANSSELNSIRKEIKSNIEILKASSRLRRIDKLENRLSNAKKSYNELNNRFNDELININNIEIEPNTQDLLEFLYSLTGRNEISNSFWTKFSFEGSLYVVDVKIIREKVIDEIYSNKLKSYEDIELRIKGLINEYSSTNNLLKHIDSFKCKDEVGIPIEDCIGIKNKLKNEVKSDKLNTTKQINFKYNELIRKKMADNLINHVYSIMGRNETPSSFFKEFLTYNLDVVDIKRIRKVIINEIKSFELKSKQEIDLRINELINQNKKVKCNILLDEFYDNLGKDNLSDSYLKRLSDNGLTKNSGNYIKSDVEGKIKEYSIKNKFEIDEEINKLVSEEHIRQNKSLNRLNELFRKDNIYLRGLSYNEKEEIRDIIVMSIKENRLDYLSVYSEYKKIIEEFKKTEVVNSEDSNNDNLNENNEENKSSQGLISKLKRFFSLK